MYQDAYQSYQTVNLGTQTAQASPVQLVLILMDGLLEELARARAHITAQRYELKARSLDKCIGILNGLSSALDTDGEGEVVGNLQRLYEFCADRLCRAGLSLDPVMVDEVTGVVSTLRQGWHEVQQHHG